MTALDDHLERLLEGIVGHFDAQPPGQRDPLFLVEVGDVEGFPTEAGMLPASRADIEELAAAGLVRMTGGSDYLVTPTSAGRERAAVHRRATLRGTQAVDLSWRSVRPVLAAVVDEWEAGGAGCIDPATLTVRTNITPHQLVAAIEALERDGWIECTWELGDLLPVDLAPLSKALSGTRGWPGGDSQAAAERLLQVLDELAEQEPDEGKRSKLRALRDFAVDLGSGTLSEILVKLGTGAL